LLETLSNRKLVYWLMYPNFYNILSRAIAVLARTASPLFARMATALLFRLLAAINADPDLSEDERRDLLVELLECMRAVGKRGVVLDKDRLRRGVERVREEDIKDSMIEVIDGLQEAKQEQGQESDSKEHPQPQPSQQERKLSEQKHEENNNSTQLEDL
jgi:hypothetical protein